MRVEETRQRVELVLYSPPPNSPEKSRNGTEERRLVIVPPAVFVEYDKTGRELRYQAGGQSWIA